jgi:hypothetical protein
MDMKIFGKVKDDSDTFSESAPNIPLLLNQIRPSFIIFLSASKSITVSRWAFNLIEWFIHGHFGRFSIYFSFGASFSTLFN